MTRHGGRAHRNGHCGRDDVGLAVAIDDALDYLTGLIPELGGVLVVVTDAYQARLAEIAAQYLRFTAISGDSAVYFGRPALPCPSRSATGFQSPPSKTVHCCSLSC